MYFLLLTCFHINPIPNLYKMIESADTQLNRGVYRVKRFAQAF
ncbi:hypothetical protein T03_12950 [Trichinella britovi]|uniref:Uncharacterized protein n=1 Tax=Trichinella britovi TaxID=45882 RepID=A0A0V1CHT2_TRIBR|nr:hypothetical protein T03_12950 [Trichinella britovi]